MRAPPGVEYRPSAALAVGVDELSDRRVEASLPQRLTTSSRFQAR